MFTVETRINGMLINHIYGHNEGNIGMGLCKYTYEFYDVENHNLKKGSVEHNRQNGINALIATIIEDMNKKEKESE